MDFPIEIAALSLGLLALAALTYYVKDILHRLRMNRKLRRLISTRGQYEFLLCDVRSQEEYEAAHIPGAVSFPLDELTYLPVEDMFLTIVVYGRTRKEALKAAGFLSDKGYFNVICYGRFKGWRGRIEQTPGLHISQFPLKERSQ